MPEMDVKQIVEEALENWIHDNGPIYEGDAMEVAAHVEEVLLEVS